jgi:hypothetical protein
MHLTTTETDILVAGIPAAAAIIVGALAALTAYLANKRENRRQLYSEAVKAAVAWEEMLYRVRRRAQDEERDLVNRFHDVQSDISYYRAWVGSESKHMQRSYDRLVRGVKKATGELINAAWADGVRPIPGNALQGEAQPDLSSVVDAFLEDVRSQLSPWFWRKLAVRSRNQEEQ